MRDSRLLALLCAPISYAGFISFLLMDMFVTVYERVCFPVYGWARVRRADYRVFDRSELPYLNGIEKLNGFCCSYGKGVAAFLRKGAACTEPYWCPIKHARRMLGTHDRCPYFLEGVRTSTYGLQSREVQSAATD